MYKLEKNIISLLFFYSVSWGFLILFFLFPVSILLASTKENFQNQIDIIDKKIEEYRIEISKKQVESRTLKGELNILNNQIELLKLSLIELQLEVAEVNNKISAKNKEIGKIEKILKEETDLLYKYLRLSHEMDQRSILEVLIVKTKISDFLMEFNSILAVQNKTKELLEETARIRNQLADQKEELENEKDDLLEISIIQRDQKKAIEKKSAEKNKLLAQTEGKEANFQELLKKTEKNKENILKQVYKLFGDDEDLTFEKALFYARLASSLTGVREAFLMALLNQETGLGQNVGTGTYKKDMKKSEWNNFLKITKNLDLDPDITPVSRKPWYGYGGAMGPAQFLPSTWLGYEKRVASLSGNNPPSPWNLKDAFIASAIKLADAGAVAGTYQAEWKAAMIYFAGSRWNYPRYRFYGDSIMAMAKRFQEQIDILDNNLTKAD